MSFWYDPMVNTLGMPGNDGGVAARLNASFAAQPAQNAALAAQNQAALNNAYGPMGFGGQTAMYAGLGAAYGRATGGFAGAPGRVGTISNPGTSNPGYLMPQAQPRAPAAVSPAASAAWARTLYNPAPMGPAQSFSPNYSPLSTRSFTPQVPTQNFNDIWSSRGAPAMSPSAISAQQLQMWNRGLPAQGGFGVPGSGAASSPLTRVYINSPAPAATRGATMPSFNSAAQQLMAQRNFTQPASFDSRFNAMLPRVNPGPSNYFDSITQAARQQPFLDAYQRGAFAPATGGAGYDIGSRARSMLSPQQVPLPAARPASAPGGQSFLGRYDWGTSFGAGNPALANALRTAGAARAPAAPTLAERFGSFAPARNPGGTVAERMALQAPGGFNPFNPAIYAGAAFSGGINGPQPTARAAPNMAAGRDALAAAMMSRFGGGLTAQDMSIPHAYPPSVRR